jgi:hypothetical protein
MPIIPVVNYGRMERLRPPEVTDVPMNVNTFCIVFIVLCILGLYRRSVLITQAQKQSYT